MSLFEICSSEIDPFSTQLYDITMYSVIPISQVSQIIYTKYLSAHLHFQNQILHQFNPQIVAIFLQEITKYNKDQHPLTIGHLTSYINMRTGMDFRNRALVKLLKRMGIFAPYHILYQSIREYLCKS